MTLLDILLVVLITLWTASAVLFLLSRKKSDACPFCTSGNCRKCKKSRK